jgi:hypothetical protein
MPSKPPGCGSRTRFCFARKAEVEAPFLNLRARSLFVWAAQKRLSPWPVLRRFPLTAPGSGVGSPRPLFDCGGGPRRIGAAPRSEDDRNARDSYCSSERDGCCGTDWHRGRSGLGRPADNQTSRAALCTRGRNRFRESLDWIRMRVRTRHALRICGQAGSEALREWLQGGFHDCAHPRRWAGHLHLRHTIDHGLTGGTAGQDACAGRGSRTAALEVAALRK